ncbi:hypothetical protein [Niabella beijingensis]|uniref:hypothetical protein n=1 Tax=Niabella beijingensis TaxID=2872700 RepID=UPI001CBA8770|nr:hypothetical protein [Niabella beijingensis]MBZ4187945.1 hypothetical protein [Niabella beijingensis]
MQLQTSYTFYATRARLWPLLFHSKMDDRKPCYFLFGLPKPMECRLADGSGGVGATSLE